MGANNTNTTDKDKFVPQATKISSEADMLLDRLERRTGISKYKILQMSIDTIIRYMDDRHNLTPEMEKAMAVFEHMSGWDEAFNLADPTVRKEIGEAIYFLQDPTGEKQGVRAVHVNKPYFGERTATYNLSIIFEHALRLLAPERYKRLTAMKDDMECESILELFDHLIDLHRDDADTEEFRQMFESCQRHDWGKEYAYGNKAKRKPHRDIEHIKGLFDDEQG